MGGVARNLGEMQRPWTHEVHRPSWLGNWLQRTENLSSYHFPLQRIKCQVTSGPHREENWNMKVKCWDLLCPPHPFLSPHYLTDTHTHTLLLQLLRDQLFFLLHPSSSCLLSVHPSVCLTLSFSLSLSWLLLSKVQSNHSFQICTMISAFDIPILNQK